MFWGLDAASWVCGAELRFLLEGQERLRDLSGVPQHLGRAWRT